MIFRSAFVSFRLLVLITSEPSAGACISTSHGPQMAATCSSGQKTLSLRKKTLSSHGLTTKYEPVGERYGSSGERSIERWAGALAKFGRGSELRARSVDERGSACPAGSEVRTAVGAWSVAERGSVPGRSVKGRRGGSRAGVGIHGGRRGNMRTGIGVRVGAGVG